MKRREFITLLGCAAAAWPLAARAQQRERVRRIGVLSNVPADDPEIQARMAAFHQGLQETGWIVGRTVRIDYRWSSAGDAEQARKYAAELIALAPEVILAVATATVGPLQQATRTTPIVFVQVAGSGAAAEFHRRQTSPGRDIQARQPIFAPASDQRRQRQFATLEGDQCRSVGDRPAPSAAEPGGGGGGSASQQDRAHRLGGDAPA